MPGQFTIHLDQAEKTCREPDGDLPLAAALLRGQIPAISDPVELFDSGTDGQFDAADRLHARYRQFREEMAVRQARGCDGIQMTAEALRDIIAVYRRVDGQD